LFKDKIKFKKNLLIKLNLMVHMIQNLTLGIKLMVEILLILNLKNH